MKAGLKRIGFLCTGFTMEKEFYDARLTEKFGLEVIIPHEQSRLAVHDVMCTELVNGIIEESSRELD
jgi:aspartate racemase